jgi:nitrogen-specific signal transduction histidine kinase
VHALSEQGLPGWNASMGFITTPAARWTALNLGTNAAHAMWEKGGLMTIGLSCFAVAPGDVLSDLIPGSYVKLSITDTGTGMEKDVLERVFDPFFTTKKQGEGTGLGLWVVHSIVKNHKGTIMMKSVPGQGSTFDVFLPRLQEQGLQASDQSWVLRGAAIFSLSTMKLNLRNWRR